VVKKIDAIGIWIKLALSDLKASKILYEQKLFRQSYFLFQQATEKANKAHALKFGLAKEEDLKDMGHNQFKIDRKYVATKIAGLDSLLKQTNKLPAKLDKKHKDLKQSLSAIDSLRNQNLVNLSSLEISSLYKQISSQRIPFEERNPGVKKLLQDAGEAKRGYLLALALLQWTSDLAYIKLAISACSILTVQHSTLTRYPENGNDPTKIYTLRLPLVKKQPLFMNLLEDAICKMDKHSDKEILKKLLKSKAI
jgi:hypothetical protein